MKQHIYKHQNGMFQLCNHLVRVERAVCFMCYCRWIACGCILCIHFIVPRVALHCVIVTFPGHIHLLHIYLVYPTKIEGNILCFNVHYKCFKQSVVHISSQNSVDRSVDNIVSSTYCILYIRFNNIKKITHFLQKLHFSKFYIFIKYLIFFQI